MEDIKNEKIARAEKVFSDINSIIKAEDWAKLPEMSDCENAIDRLCEIYSVFAEAGDSVMLMAVERAAKEIVKVYANYARNAMLAELETYENPMLEAALRMTYPVIGVTVKRIKESNSTQLTKCDREKEINPIMVQKKVKNASADPQWVDMLNALNCLLAIRVANDFSRGDVAKLAIGENYKLSNVAKAYLKIEKISDIKAESITTKRIQQVFQKCVNGMIGKFDASKVTKADVAYLVKAESTIRKAGTIQCLDDSKYSVHILKIINLMLTEKGYELMYPAKKSK